MRRQSGQLRASTIRRGVLFAALGLAIYVVLAVGSEVLAWRTGRTNAFHKIETATEIEFDWVMLGASHAMPLDFGDFNAALERRTGLRIINLAAPGAGPLYSRFTLDHFLRGHRGRNVLYVLDPFSLYSRQWNEERLSDPKLLARTPFRVSIALQLAGTAWRYGVDPRAVLNYASGFAKVNNRDRFETDVWEGETQFDRVARPSSTAIAKRVAYLYPDGTPAPAFARYLAQLDLLIGTAQASGARVVVVTMPLPQAFRDRLPRDAAADAALSELFAKRGVAIHDFSATLPDLRFYFDTDHLNRAGAQALLDADLAAVLTGR